MFDPHSAVRRILIGIVVGIVIAGVIVAIVLTR
jgi:hypothetical protein